MFKSSIQRFKFSPLKQNKKHKKTLKTIEKLYNRLIDGMVAGILYSRDCVSSS